MATKRKAITKKVRFEVFKRDSFKCQYCGNSAPDIILNVDHIHPVSQGGDNDMMNYITSCFDCNNGKSDKLLSDTSAVSKQKAQLDALNERREQLEQMIEWREGLRHVDNLALQAAVDAWNEIIVGYSLNDKGELSLKKILNKYDLNLVLDSMKLCEKYIEIDDEGKLTQESVSMAFTKIAGICRMSSEPDWKRDLYYIRGIARNRFTFTNQQVCIDLLIDAYESGVFVTDLKRITLTARSWSNWVNEIECAMESQNGTR